MTNFDLFINEYGLPVNPKKPTVNILKEYQHLLPLELIEFWQNYGFGGCADGLLWIVNPEQLENELVNWIPREMGERVIPILRTAFGKIIFWKDGRNTLLDVHHNDSFEGGGNIKTLLTFSLISKPAKQSVLKISDFKKVYKKLGPLQEDEMYSYKLPLAMGGNDNLENMVKVKMKEQLSILAQVHGLI